MRNGVAPAYACGAEAAGPAAAAGRAEASKPTPGSRPQRRWPASGRGTGARVRVTGRAARALVVALAAALLALALPAAPAASVSISPLPVPSPLGAPEYVFTTGALAGAGPEGRVEAAGALVPSGASAVFALVGGLARNNSAAYDDVWLFKLETGAWAEAPAPATAPTRVHAHACGYDEIRNGVYCAGGIDGTNGGYSDLFWFFPADFSTREDLAPMLVPAPASPSPSTAATSGRARPSPTPSFPPSFPPAHRAPLQIAAGIATEIYANSVHRWSRGTGWSVEVAQGASEWAPRSFAPSARLGARWYIAGGELDFTVAPPRDIEVYEVDLNVTTGPTETPPPGRPRLVGGLPFPSFLASAAGNVLGACGGSLLLTGPSIYPLLLDPISLAVLANETNANYEGTDPALSTLVTRPAYGYDAASCTMVAAMGSDSDAAYKLVARKVTPTPSPSPSPSPSATPSPSPTSSPSPSPSEAPSPTPSPSATPSPSPQPTPAPSAPFPDLLRFPSYEVLYPTVDSILVAGSPYPLSWSSNMTLYPSATVRFGPDGGPDSSFLTACNGANVGACRFTPPSGLAPGTYRVSVNLSGPSAAPRAFLSAPFRLASPPGSAALAPSVSLHLPPADEGLYIGGTLSVSWETAGIAPPHRAALSLSPVDAPSRAGGTQVAEADSDSAFGALAWTLALPAPGRYRLALAVTAASLAGPVAAACAAACELTVLPYEVNVTASVAPNGTLEVTVSRARGAAGPAFAGPAAALSLLRYPSLEPAPGLEAALLLSASPAPSDPQLESASALLTLPEGLSTGFYVLQAQVPLDGALGRSAPFCLYPSCSPSLAFLEPAPGDPPLGVEVGGAVEVRWAGAGLAPGASVQLSAVNLATRARAAVAALAAPPPPPGRPRTGGSGRLALELPPALLLLRQPAAGARAPAGALAPVRWDSWGLRAAPLTLRLLREAAAPVPATPVLTIAAGASNTGSYDWRVPPDTPPGRYRVEISALGFAVADRSADFAVVPGPASVAPSYSLFPVPDLLAGQQLTLRWGATEFLAAQAASVAVLPASGPASASPAPVFAARLEPGALSASWTAAVPPGLYRATIASALAAASGPAFAVRPAASAAAAAAACLGAGRGEAELDASGSRACDGAAPASFAWRQLGAPDPRRPVLLRDAGAGRASASRLRLGRTLLEVTATDRLGQSATATLALDLFPRRLVTVTLCSAAGAGEVARGFNASEAAGPLAASFAAHLGSRVPASAFLSAAPAVCTAPGPARRGLLQTQAPRGAITFIFPPIRRRTGTEVARLLQAMAAAAFPNGPPSAPRLRVEPASRYGYVAVGRHSKTAAVTVVAEAEEAPPGAVTEFEWRVGDEALDVLDEALRLRLPAGTHRVAALAVDGDGEYAEGEPLLLTAVDAAACNAARDLSFLVDAAAAAEAGAALLLRRALLPFFVQGGATRAAAVYDALGAGALAKSAAASSLLESGPRLLAPGLEAARSELEAAAREGAAPALLLLAAGAPPDAAAARNASLAARRRASLLAAALAPPAPRPGRAAWGRCGRWCPPAPREDPAPGERVGRAITAAVAASLAVSLAGSLAGSLGGSAVGGAAGGASLGVLAQAHFVAATSFLNMELPASYNATATSVQWSMLYLGRFWRSPGPLNATVTAASGAGARRRLRGVTSFAREVGGELASPYLEESLVWSALALSAVSILQGVALLACRFLFRMPAAPKHLWFPKPQVTVVIVAYEGFVIAAAATARVQSAAWRAVGVALLAGVAGTAFAFVVAVVVWRLRFEGRLLWQEHRAPPWGRLWGAKDWHETEAEIQEARELTALPATVTAADAAEFSRRVLARSQRSQASLPGLEGAASLSPAPRAPRPALDPEAAPEDPAPPDYYDLEPPPNALRRKAPPPRPRRPPPPRSSGRPGGPPARGAGAAAGGRAPAPAPACASSPPGSGGSAASGAIIDPDLKEDNSFWTAENFRWTFDVFFLGYRGDNFGRWFGIWDFSRKLIAGLVVGLVLDPDPDAAEPAFVYTAAQLGALVGVNAVDVAYVLAARPFREPVENYVQVLLDLCQAAVLALLLAVAREPDGPRASDCSHAASALQMAAIGVLLLNQIRAEQKMFRWLFSRLLLPLRLLRGALFPPPRRHLRFYSAPPPPPEPEFGTILPAHVVNVFRTTGLPPGLEAPPRVEGEWLAAADAHLARPLVLSLPPTPQGEREAPGPGQKVASRGEPAVHVDLDGWEEKAGPGPGLEPAIGSAAAGRRWQLAGQRIKSVHI
eukprot:tig00020961_g16628.t1